MFSFSRENTSLVAKWWRNIDKQILFLFIFLLMLGLFFSFSSTTSVVSEKMNKQTYFFFIKHFVFVFISLFLLVGISIQEKSKNTILLSPAAASFDQFNNFESRGFYFKNLIAKKFKQRLNV